MANSLRSDLLTLSVKIGRALRDNAPYEVSYPHAVDLLAELEDTLADIAKGLPEDSTLSGKPNGYLPSRHPQTLRNTLAGQAANVHPALRPCSQMEDFSE